MKSTNSERINAQLKLALLGDCGCLKTLSDLSSKARAQGLTGAEIDTALAGRSFEARSDAAIVYACAIKSGDNAIVSEARDRAMRLGLTESELDTVASAARDILAGSGQ